ncbi:MAG: RecQ family ATP-dependent DNA helicase, partial [Firmicutes bacterium]|nr:RecQ family ATP-dependent DNA helicase [Bacillota bacterium]
MEKLEILKEYFGHTAFRGGQEQAVNAILSGRDVLGVMPTGAGKSICYQVPALMLDGLTIVISPLISLMKDQVNSLWQAGVRAGYINSSLTAQQAKQTYRAAYSGELDILYAAPERLLTEGFLNMASQVKIAQVTVDEAHCISQWGQDFRPSYLKISQFIEKLPQRPVISAFTATATEQVRRDIVRLLALKDPLECVTGFDRRNLRFTVYAPKDKYRKLSGILENNRDKCVIVYCLTRKKTEEVCARLCAAGFNATRYHAGLSDEERRQNQEDFIYDRKNVMVATNAFGMGIDKSNVGLVVHFNMPKNIESYYQEAGRAGRDGSDAECIMLYGVADVRTNRFLIDNGDDFNPDLTPEQRENIRKKDIIRLNKMTEYCRTTRCYRNYILKYFGEKSPDYCGNCSNCLSDFDAVDITVDAQKIISCVYRAKQKGKSWGRAMLADILAGADTAKIRQ